METYPLNSSLQSHSCEKILCAYCYEMKRQTMHHVELSLDPSICRDNIMHHLGYITFKGLKVKMRDIKTGQVFHSKSAAALSANIPLGSISKSRRFSERFEEVG